MPTIDRVFQLALRQHQAGRLDVAQSVYRQIIAADPNHPEALHLLGVIVGQSGRNDEAVALIQRSIAARANVPEAYYNLGNALMGTGQVDAAIAAYRQALALKPDLVDAHYNLGNALMTKGQREAAVAAYRQALAFHPKFAEAWSNLGNAFHQLGQLDDAITAHQQALTLKPNFPKAISNLGSVLKDKGQLDLAIAAYQKAIALKPDYFEAYNNLGNALRAKKQLDAAIAALRQTIALKPDYAIAHNNLGNVLVDKKQLAEAIAAYRRSIALDPKLADVHFRLGNALWEHGQLDEAIAAFRQAVAIKPNYSAAHSNLIFALAYRPQYDAAAIADEARRWNQQHALPLKPLIRPHANDRDPDRKLKIGYVSADLHKHAIAFLFLPVLENHDPDNVHITCYYNNTIVDETNERIRKRSDAWRDIARHTNQQIADQIREDQIDILVDLSGHTASHRLLVFARKPAPVQVTWLAPPGTTGLDAMDYRFSDPCLDPPAMNTAPFYSEQIFRLPDIFWCFDPLTTEPPVNPLPALSAPHITFGCLNNFYKITESTLVLWSRILREVPASRLLLLSFEGALRQQTLDFLVRQGVAPERVEFSGRVKHAEYLKLYHRIDIGLDTLPYNGHTTTFDSLWMGVPVITTPGATAVGRAGAGFMTNLGLSDWIAPTLDDYIQTAIRMAANLPDLATLRAALRPRMERSPLMDAQRFTRNIEAAYRQMWQKWCASPQTAPDAASAT